VDTGHSEEGGEYPIPGKEGQRTILPIPPPLKEDGKKNTAIPAPFYADVLFI
jgi:hypothetical protein